MNIFPFKYHKCTTYRCWEVITFCQLNLQVKFIYILFIKNVITFFNSCNSRRKQIFESLVEQIWVFARRKFKRLFSISSFLNILLFMKCSNDRNKWEFVSAWCDVYGERLIILFFLGLFCRVRLRIVMLENTLTIQQTRTLVTQCFLWSIK